MLNTKEAGLLEALEAHACDMGVEIVTLEITGAKKSPIIRVYIDTPTSVSFQELSSAQEWIGEIIERIDPFPGAYTLEVSSPGIDRPLRTKEHFARFAGEDVRIRVKDAINGAKNIKGELLGIDGDIVKVSADKGIIEIDHDNIQRANVVGKIEF